MELKRSFYRSFFTGIYRDLDFERIEWIPVRFYSHFPEFLTNTSPFLLKFVNFFWKVLLIFICKDRKYCRLFLLICQKFWLIISKLRLFHQKQHEISFISPVRFKFTGSTDPTTTNTILLISKGGFFYFKFRWECSVVKTLPFFLNLFVDYQNAASFFYFLTSKIQYL